MFDKKIHLNDFFNHDFMETSLQLYGFTPTGIYPGLQKILNYYKNELKKSSGLSALLNFKETFIQKIYINDNNFYVIAWRIPVVKKIIKKYNLPLCKFKLDEIIDLVHPQYINKAHLGTALKNNAPIFMVSYPPVLTENKFLLIDGNHRVTSKHIAGQKEISGYILEPEQHLQAMVCKLDQTLFKIHYNYYMIASYIGGVIGVKELQEKCFHL